MIRIKSIINQDISQIKTCETEPIHIPGSIQPHGFLLGLDPNTCVVQFCSANCADLFGKQPEDLILQPLSALLPDNWPSLQTYLTTQSTGQMPFQLSIKGIAYELVCGQSQPYLLLEIEALQPDTQADNQVFEQTRQFVSLIEKSKSLQQLCQRVAEQTRALTGYDRVMIYRFDKHYNGEVYAESRRDDLEPYLGLHYPHTDIPPQARDLYLRNLLRLIVDVDYTPVPLLALDDGTEKKPDLSNAQLRSVSPIHIQYLKNMKVGATLTISLVQDGKLWGLIACHHQQPKNLSFTQRQRALLQGHLLTSQIRVRLVAEEYEVNLQVEAHLQQLLHKLEAEEEFDLKFEQFTSLLPVANATGVVIVHDGQYFVKGNTPGRDEIAALLDWLETNIRSVQFTTACLHTRYPRAEAISDTAAGILYHALGKPSENCVIWFREEVEQTVNWAGNPSEAVQQDTVTKSLSPRHSFALWKERVRFQSREWRVSEINAAGRFATALQNHIHLLHLQQEDFRLRTLNDKLHKANQELSNINWITSHDLKEPLRKIEMFISKINSQSEQDLSEVIRHSISRIEKSAHRMRALVDDILAYTLTTDKRADFTPTDLNRLLQEVLDNLQDDIEEQKARIESETLPDQVRVIPFQIRQLFTNLLSNALKFSTASEPIRVTVTYRLVRGEEVANAVLKPDARYHEVSITDNGIGFNQEQHNRIFDIFYRLHSTAQYKGTGMGLAIAKKIVENHKGAIRAYGTPEQGATFSVYLPV